MPLYEYTCECGYSEERLVKHSESSAGFKCPECGENIYKDFPKQGIVAQYGSKGMIRFMTAEERQRTERMHEHLLNS